MTHHIQKIISEKISDINKIKPTYFDNFLLKEITLLLEAYSIGKNINSDNTITIDGKTIQFSNLLSKHNGKTYILVDFYVKNEDNTKNYSTLPKKQTTKEYLERESKILSSAYDSAILFMLEKNKQLYFMDKQLEISGIGFFPKQSETDNKRLNKDTYNNQRTLLYKRFIEQIFGKDKFTISSDSGNVYLNFNNIELTLGSVEFKEQIKQLPYAEEIVAVYGLNF
jgi:hypothetical protein